MRHFYLVVVLLVGMHGSIHGADPTNWIGVKVFPKVNCVIKDGDNVFDVKYFLLPFTVKDVKDDLLLIGESKKKGWVQKSHVVTIDEAPAYYTELINSNRPKNALTYNLRALAWKEQGELELAIADFGESLRLKPDVTGYNNRGNAWHDKKELDKAVADFNQAIQLDPTSAPAYYNRGVVWQEKKELDKAIADCDEAIRLDPSYVLAYNHRGVVWRDKKEYDKAIVDFNQAIQLDPTFALAYHNRGLVWRSKQEYDKAIADYGQVIQLDPNCALAFYNRGVAWHIKQELDKAIADYDQAIRLDPKFAFAYGNRGNAWTPKNELDKAIADFNEAIRLDPNIASVINTLAWLHATCPVDRVRDGKKAVEYATKACELTAWKVWYCLGTLAAAYAEAGDFTNAVKWAEKSLELAPENKKQDANDRLELYRSNKPYRDVPKE